MTGGVIKSERKRSWKASTAAKWTSTPDYRDNYDRIFGKKPKCDECTHRGARDAAMLHLDAITTGANVHRLAQVKQLLISEECDHCREGVKKALGIING